MGFFDTLKGLFMDPSLVEDLCIHLKNLGINAKVLDPKSTEAVQHSPTLGIFGNPPMGSIKIEGRNIDLVEIERAPAPSGNRSIISVLYSYVYIVKGNIRDDAHAQQLKADVKVIEKGLINKVITGFEWRGGEVAQRLSDDSELRDMIRGIGMPNIQINPHTKDQYVAITVSSQQRGKIKGFLPSTESLSKMLHELGMLCFPSREEFEVYDKIAKHVRTIVGLSTY